MPVFRKFSDKSIRYSYIVAKISSEKPIATFWYGCGNL